MDRHGALLKNLVNMPVFPVPSARFLGHGFKDGMVKAWRQARPLRAVDIATAGNGLQRGADEEKIRTAVRRMSHYWAAGRDAASLRRRRAARWQAF